jgi:hypothetical protein
MTRKRYGLPSHHDAKDESRGKPSSQDLHVFELTHTKCFPQSARHGGILRFWNHEILLEVPKHSESTTADAALLPRPSDSGYRLTRLTIVFREQLRAKKVVQLPNATKKFFLKTDCF